MLKQECKARWSSTCYDSLIKTHEIVQMYCVKVQMTDGDGKNVKMGFEDWDIIGQDTPSLTTITDVVK